MKNILFYVLSILTLLSAISVVTTRHLFRGALALIGVLAGVAGMYLLMNAQFLAAVQITVYIGGIVVLIVYVVMLISDVTHGGISATQTWRKAISGILAAILFVLLVIAAAPLGLVDYAQATSPRSASIAEIGKALLSPEKGGFILAFELISLLLIAAIIGAVTIAYPSKEKEIKRPEKGELLEEARK
ncbi:MAG: NADH-quinone oxidoreductase subunit J [Verrucomicrobiae bacterium]|nr:NADH-quinone oxidoreductase subunit J [Verrucomicrobiae bacterium]